MHSMRKPSLLALAGIFILLGGGCGIDDAQYIAEPGSQTPQSGLYFFLHKPLEANNGYPNFAGYEILYRFHHNAQEMVTEEGLISSNAATNPGGAYQYLINSLGYKRMTLSDFQRESIIVKSEISMDANATVKLDFINSQNGGIEEPSIAILDDQGNELWKQTIYRGIKGSAETGSGLSFLSIKKADTDVKPLQAVADTQGRVYIQAYAFTIGRDFGDFSTFYSIPTRISSDSTQSIMMSILD